MYDELEPSNGHLVVEAPVVEAPLPDVRQQTPPQVSVSVQWDGELDRPRDVGVTFYRKARLMRRDPTIAMARWFATAPIVGGSWSVECDEGVPDGAKELIEQQMQYLRYDLLQTALYGCYDFGWQAFEKCFVPRDDGLYWCRYLKPLYHDWTEILVLAHTGEYAGVKQSPPHVLLGVVGRRTNIELYLSTEEVMLTYIDAEGTNWYGEPYSKVAEKPYDDWNTASRSAERYDRKIAGSHWVIYYPRGETKYNGVMTDNGVIADDLAKRLHSVSAVTLPRSIQEVVDTLSAEASKNESLQWKIEVVEAKSSTSTAILDRLKYLDGLKARAYKFPERAILEGVFGTKAEAEAHADLAITGLDMRHVCMTNMINRDLVNQTVRLNYGRGLDDKIRLVPSPLTDAAKDFLRTLYQAVMADPAEMMMIDKAALRERLKVPELKYVEPEWMDPFAMPTNDPFATGYEQYPMIGPPAPGEPPLEGPIEDTEPPVQFAFDPSQPRETDGKWGAGGGGDKSKGRKSGEKKSSSSKSAAKAAVDRWKESSDHGLRADVGDGKNVESPFKHVSEDEALAVEKATRRIKNVEAVTLSPAQLKQLHTPQKTVTVDKIKSMIDKDVELHGSKQWLQARDRLDQLLETDYNDEPGNRGFKNESAEREHDQLREALTRHADERIRVIEHNGKMYLGDGHHRLAAALASGKSATVMIIRKKKK